MGFQHLAFSIVIFYVATCATTTTDQPQVEIQQGVLVGTPYESRNGRQFYSFTGIPYAKPPVGKLRFKPPVAAKPWEGIFDATKPHAVCPQIDSLVSNETVIGDEDCLYLNVYTPRLETTKDALLPVMFYIHGGWFSSGSANINEHGPKYLLDKDVVLVTANYRLGPFGFAMTTDLAVMANNGLRDQVMAIQWVKQNIASFGGDPIRITVVGQSTGAVSAHMLMLAPSSQNLISGVIAQSGSVLQYSAISSFFQVIIRTKILAGGAGCPTYDHQSKEMLKCLKELNTTQIILGAEELKQWEVDPLTLFGPTIEPGVPEAFIPLDPVDAIVDGKAANIPLLTGLTTHEGTIKTAELFSNAEVLQKLNSNIEEYGSMFLGISQVAMVMHREKSTKKAKQFYLGDMSIDESTKAKFAKMYADAIYLSGISSTVGVHAKVYSAPVYYYLFGYKGSASMCSFFDSETEYKHEVCHGDDLLYLFNSDKWPNLSLTEEDEKMIDAMVSLWTNFATYGNPTPDDDTVFVEKWKPVKPGQENYYEINSPSDMKLKTGLYTKRVNFWRSLPLSDREDKLRDTMKAEVKDEL